MPRIPRKIIKYVLVVLNVFSVLGMMACGYSIYFEPQHYPNLSYWGQAFPVFLVTTILFAIFWLFVRWRMALISLAGLLLCIGSVRAYYPINIPFSPPEGSIKFLSYNIQGMGRTSDGRDWRKAGVPWEETPIVLYLLTCGADIVCCQEAGRINNEKVDPVLAEVYPHRMTLHFRNAYYSCLSRFPIIDGDSILFPSKGNGSVYYHLLIGKDTMLVVNNHFESYKLKDDDKRDYKNILTQPEKEGTKEHIDSLTHKLSNASAIRGIQADMVDSLIARSTAKYIVACGDFNDASISYVHYRMTRHLNDAYTRSGNGPGFSYNRSGMYFRIDNILCSDNITPYGAHVDSSIETSDHYPIYCWLSLE